MISIFKREFIYLWYYFTLQLQQILFYWILGMVLGSIISVFAKNRIHRLFASKKDKPMGILGVIPASALGILSPLCMYGTIPLASSFSENGMEDDWLAAFMMSSILLNPQLMLYSTALGPAAFWIRLLSSFACGALAGVLVRLCFRKKGFFNFHRFAAPVNRDTDSNLFLRFLKNLYRNVRATGGYFLLGIALSAIFQRYVPAEGFALLFGRNEGFGLLMAATIGVPLYVCGGGTIPLLLQWMASGMSLGAASSFMITGPATKITNLGALKIVLGARHFFMYVLYVMGFSLFTGWVVNLLV